MQFITYFEIFLMILNPVTLKLHFLKFKIHV